MPASFQSATDMPSEKNARGLLKAAADRGLARAKRRLVLLDSMNAIKASTAGAERGSRVEWGGVGGGGQGRFPAFWALSGPRM